MGKDSLFRAKADARHAVVTIVAVAVALACSGAGAGEGEKPPAFWKSTVADVEQAVKAVGKGKARALIRSTGGRDVYLVSYGEGVERHATANYNSACAGQQPAAYARKDGTQRPVVLLLGPVHGGEMEGVVGLLNLIRVAESGEDWRGRRWERLAGNLAACRVLIVPLGNPDARARFPWDSSVGRTLEEYERLLMGVGPDGKVYQWPGVKRIHPMRGVAVTTLGAYFTDEGVNLMHDEWFAPMARETTVFLNLARDEAPDYVVSLHTRASYPAVLPTAYVPKTVKETISGFGGLLQQRYAAAGLPRKSAGPAVEEDGKTFPPPSFNLVSALHHVCGAVTMVHEACAGVADARYPQLTHEQILDSEMLLFDELLEYAVRHRVAWAASGVTDKGKN